MKSPLMLEHLQDATVSKQYPFSTSPDPEADQEASEMLTDNAQNLMQAVSEVLYATEAATIRVPPDARESLGLKWVKRGHAKTVVT